ncbi:MAG: amino acid racemase [FCB group bacterium]|nr:amino acid racemase [FCB group bacterium]
MHRKIGLVGGLSPESTLDYYRYLIHSYRETYGNEYYPEIVIYSVPFQQYAEWSQAGAWDKIADGLIEAANFLAAVHCELAALTANTMHRVFDQVQAAVDVCMISIVETTGEALKNDGIEKVALLGTKYTMTDPAIYFNNLAEKGIEILVPDNTGIGKINNIIYSELTKGVIKENSKKVFLEEIAKLIDRGAQGVILGCTEIPLIVSPEEISVKSYDTMELNADAILRIAVQQEI